MLWDHPLPPADALRENLREYLLADESRALDELLPEADLGGAGRAGARRYATALVEAIRREQSGRGGVDALLNEFSLSTEEGVVLMCLAEAMLRVPDSLTADRLISDKMLSGDWGAHVGHSHSLFVNASAWGLLFTGTMVGYTDEDKRALNGVLKRTVGRLGQPVIRAAVRYAMGLMGDTFVMGKSIEDAMERARKQEARGYRYSFDMLGEGARTAADAERYYRHYQAAIDAIGQHGEGVGPVESPGISVKLSAIHPRYDFAHRERVMRELVPRLKALASLARDYDIGLTVDAEEASRLDLSLDVIAAVFSDHDLTGWQGFGMAVQAYQKRAPRVIDWANQLAQRTGRRMMLRLVKGAYWDTEIKIAQVEGLRDYPVFTRKPSTDVCFQACARKMLGYREHLYPQFATHNAYSVAAVLEMDDSGEDYEFQRLHGMGEALYDRVMADTGIPCRIYAPVGEHADLLAYLVRRLLENGANSSFVNNIVDETVPVDALVADPVSTVRGWRERRNPAIALPVDLYGSERVNSRGFDLSDLNALRPLQRQMLQAWREQQSHSQPAGVTVTDPADSRRVVGSLDYDTASSTGRKLARAQSAFKAWSQTPVAERAERLNCIGDALEAHSGELIMLCCREAGKNIADGLAEVREAVDFCRYYARQAKLLFNNDGAYEPRGVVLCISPWNFPLAIFTGQVTAALAAGNTVLAKPAEQSSLLAQRAVALMRESGLPEGAVELVLGPGKTAGENLVPDSRIAAVMFTGSVATAHWLNRALAERNDAPLPLIAETGGQNAMIVDSTALPEQVVDDVIRSGFQSAGQRCSALRVLFLQEETSDELITMIKGAMDELSIGDSALLATDVGPVIDEKALARLEEHVRYMKGRGELLHVCKLPSTCEHGHFFAPRLYEIDDLSVLREEVFGPVIHVIRYRAEELDTAIDQINAAGYGLTLGVHSRIQRTADRIARRARVGNVYVNRDMIGAVVGVQPFGGRGLSGTGPKAGGPNYLKRLVQLPSAAMTDKVRTPSSTPMTESEKEPYLFADVIPAKTGIRPCEEIAKLIDTLAAEKSLHTLRLPGSDRPVLELCRDYLEQVVAPLLTPVTLQGPTGESNRLFHEPRGHLLALFTEQDDQAYALLGTLLALATGNTVTISLPGAWLENWQRLRDRAIESGLPGTALSVENRNENALPVEHLTDPAIVGVLLSPDSILAAQTARILASRPGPIPALIDDRAGNFYPSRFVQEKTVTIDTTAAGGNTSLMTQSEDSVARSTGGRS